MNATENAEKTLPPSFDAGPTYRHEDRLTRLSRAYRNVGLSPESAQRFALADLRVSFTDRVDDADK